MAKAKPASSSAPKPKRKPKPQFGIDGNAASEPKHQVGLGWLADPDLGPEERSRRLRHYEEHGTLEPIADAEIRSSAQREQGTREGGTKGKVDTSQEPGGEADDGTTAQTEAGTPQTSQTAQEANAGGGNPVKHNTQIDSQVDAGMTGGVSITSAEPEPPGPVLTRETAKQDAHRRWRNEGRAEAVAAFRDRMRMEYVAAHPKCKRRDAHEHAWDRAMAEFPPAGVEPKTSVAEKPSPIGDGFAPVAPTYSPIADQGVSGLSDIPLDWPNLPANASLQIEIAWVSANRLRVRSGTGVDLARALSPAPSYSALSWLETSILFPSKFADISVKATAQQDDEKEYIRREKASIEEIRGILKEMLDAKPSPIGDES